MKILFIDPVFGISGDMMMAALIDAGVPFSEMASLLGMIPGDPPPIEPVKRRQGVMEGTGLRIGPSDLHFSVADMYRIIDGLPVSERVRGDSRSMLALLVGAEASVHGVPAEQVHLHELSHVDTLIDILSVARGMEYLGIDRVFSGPIPFGRGRIATAHGMIPNPAPATVRLLEGFKVSYLDVPLELTTPTGAAIVRHFVRPGAEPPCFRIIAEGLGVGNYESDIPDVLRLFVGEAEGPLVEEDVWVLETDLDDMETEYLGGITEKLRTAGALDVLCWPVYMKKGRVGLRLSVSVHARKLEAIVDALFRETSTFGMRLRREQRRVLARDEKVVDTPYGSLRVKRGFDAEGKPLKIHLEHDDVQRLAGSHGIPAREMLRRLLKAIED